MKFNIAFPLAAVVAAVLLTMQASPEATRRPPPPQPSAGLNVEAFADLPRPNLLVTVRPAPQRPAQAEADAEEDLSRLNDSTLVSRAIAIDTVANRPAVQKALEIALESRRTDVATAHSLAELLASRADNIGYIEWVVFALASNLSQREEGLEPEAALEAAYTNVIEKLLAQQKNDLAELLSDQALRTRVPSEDLIAARARVAAAQLDFVLAEVWLRSITTPAATNLAQQALYLDRAGETSAARLAADRARELLPSVGPILGQVTAP